MDNQIQELINQCIYNSKDRVINQIPSFVHNLNIPFFKVLNIEQRINIFDFLSLKVKFYNGEILVLSDNVLENKIPKGSKIISVNGRHPLSNFKLLQSYKLTIEIKTNYNVFQRIDIIRKSPLLDMQNSELIITRHNDVAIMKITGFDLPIFSGVDFCDLDGKTLIIDVRDNKGGKLLHLLSILEWFFEEQEVIMNVEFEERIYRITSKLKKKINPKKIYILINKDSYSCSEILADVLKRKGATILGSESGGKFVLTKTCFVGNYKYQVPFGKYSKSSNSELIHISDSCIERWINELIV